MKRRIAFAIQLYENTAYIQICDKGTFKHLAEIYQIKKERHDRSLILYR